MKRYTDETNRKKDAQLASLLQRRKAPLSSEAMTQVLEDLTWHMSGPVQFYCAVFPKEEAMLKDELDASDIEKVDIMYASDEERYFPVFTELEKLQKFKPELRDSEVICIADKQDLLDFLHANEKTAACVINPYEDDLLLYRMHLANMIKVEKER